MEAISLLCDPVLPPKSLLEYMHYFVGNPEIPDDIKTHEPQCVALYKGTAALVQAYASIADEMPKACYSDTQIKQIKLELDDCLKIREAIRINARETIDLKAYEADMRHLIDTYIEAKETRKISDFDDMGLLELILKSGMSDAVKSLPDGIKSSKGAVAETIANNVRSKIIKEHLKDPAFYDKMSALLKEILDDLRAKQNDYQTFLKRMADISKQVFEGKGDDTPKALNTPGKRALFNKLKMELRSSPQNSLAEEHPNLPGGTPGSTLNLALQVDVAVQLGKSNGWRGIQAKERAIKGIIYKVVFDDYLVEQVFLIIF